MHDVSEEYKIAIKENVRQFNIRMTIQHPGGVLDVIDEDIVSGSYKMIDGTQSGDDFSIGGAFASNISFSLVNRPKFNGVLFMGAVVKPLVGLYIASRDEFEYVPQGTFIIDAPKPQKTTIAIKAVDFLVKADVPYTTEIAHPVSLKTLYENVCSQAGLIPVEQNFQNMNYLVPRAIGKDISCRDMLRYIAQLAGCFIKCDVNGHVKLTWYSGAGKVIGPTHRKNFNQRGDVVGIKGITATIHGTRYVEGETSYSINVSDNPLLQSNYQHLIFAIFANVKDISFSPFETEWQGDPAVQAGDIITQIAADGVEHKTLITSSIFKLNGLCKIVGKGLPAISKNFTGSTVGSSQGGGGNYNTTLKTLDYYVDGFAVNKDHKFKWTTDGLLNMQSGETILIEDKGVAIS